MEFTGLSAESAYALNQVQAAKILGITRGSLRTKIRDLGIIIAKSVASSEDLDE